MHRASPHHCQELLPCLHIHVTCPRIPTSSRANTELPLPHRSPQRSLPRRSPLPLPRSAAHARARRHGQSHAELAAAAALPASGQEPPPAPPPWPRSCLPPPSFSPVCAVNQRSAATTIAGQPSFGLTTVTTVRHSSNLIITTINVATRPPPGLPLHRAPAPPSAVVGMAAASTHRAPVARAPGATSIRAEQLYGHARAPSCSPATRLHRRLSLPAGTSSTDDLPCSDSRGGLRVRIR
jgi:hypothetical protein